MTKQFLFAAVLAVISIDTMAQLRPHMPRPPQRPPIMVPNLPNPNIGGGIHSPTLPPMRPPIRPPVRPPIARPPVDNQFDKIAHTNLRIDLAHGQTIGVRRVLNDLIQGDFVKSIQGYAQAKQRGAYLEVIMDNVVIGRIDLSMRLNLFQVEIRKVNGIDYRTLMLRSIGATYVDSIQANISTGSAYPDLPTPPVVTPPTPDYPSQPDYPTYPPNNGSLAGYCEDYDHSQFTAAKDYAYSSSGLDLSSSQATEWALEYNKTHACNTIQEYSARFTVLKNFAYSSSGLDMSSRDAVNYALSKVETTTVYEAEQMQSTLTAIKDFAYSSSGLNLSSSEASAIGREWLDRGYCEREDSISQIAQRYKSEYDFAYSSSGLDYDS